jgi:hypothetical protein
MLQGYTTEVKTFQARLSDAVGRLAKDKGDGQVILGIYHAV